jgi:hypothetical protein
MFYLSWDRYSDEELSIGITEKTGVVIAWKRVKIDDITTKMVVDPYRFVHYDILIKWGLFADKNNAILKAEWNNYYLESSAFRMMVDIGNFSFIPIYDQERSLFGFLKLATSKRI